MIDTVIFIVDDDNVTLYCTGLHTSLLPIAVHDTLTYPHPAVISTTGLSV